MPPLPPVPNVLKIIIQGNSGEATELPWANVLHFEYSGTAPSNSVCATIAGEVATLWSAHMAAEQVSNLTMNFVEVQDLTSATSGVGVATPSIAGTRGDDEIPANVAFLVDYPIARRYRGGHPRTYLIVGGNADFLDAAHWSSAFTAEVGTHWGAFLSGLVGYSTSGTTISTMCNVSYYSKEITPTPPYRRVTPLVDSIAVSSLVPQQQIASQRRRVGRHRR